MKKPWLFRVYRVIILPSYVGIIINDSKDPIRIPIRAMFFSWLRCQNFSLFVGGL